MKPANKYGPLGLGKPTEVGHDFASEARIKLEVRQDIKYALPDVLGDIVSNCFRLMMGDRQEAEDELNTPYWQSYYREFFTVLGFPALAILTYKPSQAIYHFMVLMDDPSAKRHGSLKTTYDQAYDDYWKLVQERVLEK
jgi:hypothetical protein